MKCAGPTQRRSLFVLPCALSEYFYLQPAARGEEVYPLEKMKVSPVIVYIGVNNVPHDPIIPLEISAV